MKKWLMGVWITLLITLCVGCSENTSQKTNGLKESNSEAENHSDEEKPEMTVRQEEVFRSYGVSDEKLEEMKRDGLSYQEQSFVDTAIMMLDYLEEKYDEKFQVVGGDIPGILSDEYWITAEASEGEYTGVKFDVYYYGENGYRDGYITLLKQKEACEALKELILSKFSDVLIFPSMTDEYGSELTLDNTGEQMLKIVSYYCDFVIINPDMSEKKFNEISEAIEKYLNDNDVFASGSVLYLKEPVDIDMSSDDLSKLLKKNDALQWSYYLSSR